MAKKQKGMGMGVAILIVLGLLAITGGLVYVGTSLSAIGSAQTTTTIPETAGGSSGVSSFCPEDDDGVKTVTVRYFNSLNDTANQELNATINYWRVEDGEEKFDERQANSGGVTVNQDCGLYRGRLESSNANLDHSVIKGIRSGDAEVVDNGRAFEFTLNKNLNIELDGEAHDTIQVRSADQNSAGDFMFDTAGAEANSFKTTGAIFQSTTNGTALAIGAGEDLHVTFEVEAVSDQTDANEYGVYVLVNASTSIWDEPSIVKVDGTTLDEVSGELDIYESRAYSEYEFVYLIPQSVAMDDGGVDLEFRINALSGVNPGAGDDISLDFAPIGAVREVSGNGIRYSSVNDGASPTDVYTRQEFGVDVS